MVRYPRRQRKRRKDGGPFGPSPVRGGDYAAWRMRSVVMGDGLNPLTMR
jgi:hypothetical protein